MTARRSVIVTGGASGFGAGIAAAFLDGGANVVIADLNEAGAAKLAGELSARQAGGKALALHCDVTVAHNVEALITETVDRFGSIDVLVNNAGTVAAGGTLEQTSVEDFDRLFSVNCKGVFLGCRAVLPHFRRSGGGNIINIASGSALRPRAGAVVYSASKGAVITMSRALAAEVAHEGIRVNVICPSISRTPLAERYVNDNTDEVWDELARQMPLGGRLVQPRDIANAAVFLASDAAAMITGCCLPVDGGRCI